MDFMNFVVTLSGFLFVVNVISETSAADCTMGNLDTMETDDRNVPGLYLDIDHPAICTGMITAWHFCHYTPFLFSTDTYSARFQIWRENSGNNFRKVFEVSQDGEIPRFQRQFLCVDIELQESEYINVTQGDVFGVYMPESRGLRMLAMDHMDNRLYFSPPESDVSQSGQVSLDSTEVIVAHALHLTADIEEAMIIPTTINSQPTTTEGSSSPTMDTPTTFNVSRNNTGGNMQGPDGGDGGDGGLPGGATAAIIIIILLIVIGVVVAVVIVVFVLWYKNGKTFPIRKSSKSQSHSSIDNAVYEEAPVRSNSALASYLNKTSGGIDYEIPISTKSKHGDSVRLQGRVPPPESMYIAMEAGKSLQTTNPDFERSEFTDSFESYPDSQPDCPHHEVQTRTRSKRAKTDVFDIYRSFPPDDEVYCQFMEETASQTGSLPQGFVGNFDPYSDPPTNEEEIYKELLNKTREISKDEIRMMDEIGEGEFAYVNKAMWQDKAGVGLTVAVKTLHSNASQEDKIKLLQEAAIMGQFIHPNVVRLIGVVKDGDKTSLVTEFCAKGDLSMTLKNMRPDPGQLISADTAKKLLSFSQQVALAMHYLSSKGFVHRDLAARNIFVTQDNICKVGDFGMSRDLAKAEYYVSQGGAIPVKWTAPEAIYYCKYSTASDVWSYGCLLFEIWSIGMKPFGGLPNTEVLETVQSGYRLPPPPGCPEDIFKIMIECWNPKSESRPQFRDILNSMLKEDSEILQIPVSEASTHQQASQLGAPLEAGKGMYLSLQHSYLINPPSNKRETIYEAIEQYNSQSYSDEMNKITPQASFLKSPPPLPSTPIPTSKQPLLRTINTLSQSSPLPPTPTIKTPHSSFSKAPPPLPSIPTSVSKSLSQSLSQQPTYGNVEEIYDDIEGLMPSTPFESKQDKKENSYEDDIYDDIHVADPSDSNKTNFVPEVYNYEVPLTAVESKGPHDMDYEYI